MYEKKFTYKKPAGQGAKEGLLMKMKAWEDKDYATEYSIAVSQALNLAYEHAGTREPTKEEVFSIFSRILQYKLDEKFIDAFKEYYDEKLNNKAREQEKSEQRLDEAGGGLEDFGDATNKTESLL